MSLDERFPYFEVVYNTIKEHYGQKSADGWAGRDGYRMWGSSWYDSLGEMLKECKTEQDARAAVMTLFYLGEHHEHVQNSLFNHYRGMDDPIFGDPVVLYRAVHEFKQRRDKANGKKPGFFQKLIKRVGL